MKKALMKGLALAFVGSMVMAGSAMALPTEYELINPDTVGMPGYVAGVDLGYYIWTDDAARMNWHVRWSGAGPSSVFSGNILLENNTFGEFETFSWDSGQDFFLQSDEFTTFIAVANVLEDGLDFTLNNQTMPAFIGFDLFINGSQDLAAANTFIGAAGFSPEDGDFQMAAPVPEPATMLLFGSGLVGLAGYGRKKIAKK